jgi:hypothetical protein
MTTATERIDVETVVGGRGDHYAVAVMSTLGELAPL